MVGKSAVICHRVMSAKDLGEENNSASAILSVGVLGTP